VLERTCMVCHGVNFISRIPQGKEGWDAAIDLMTKPPAFAGVGGPAPMINPAWLSSDDRKVLLDYLTEHFSVDQPIRAVEQDFEPALDEDALGKAMFVEYTFPDTKEEPHRWEQETHFDANGDVWITERGGAPGIVKLDPRTGAYRDFPDPDPKGSPHGLTVAPDGTIWWGGKDVHLGHLDPVTGKIDRYVVKQKGWHGHTPVFDSKGDIWFSMLPGNKIGHWSRATDSITLIDSPEPGARPYGFIIDRSDKIWYVEYHRGAVVRYDPVTKKFTRFMIPTQPSAMRRLGIDLEGNIWYGVYGSASKFGKIGRLDPKIGKIVEFTIPIMYANPYDTWGDKDDNIWISTDNYLVKFEPKTEHSTIYPVPTRSDMPKLSATRDGAIWYTRRMSALTRGAPAGAGVLYPDKDKITTFGAYYSPSDTAVLAAGQKNLKPIQVTGRTIGKTEGGADISGTINGKRPAGAIAD
jgi:virginiamycin B lyase